MDEWKKLANDEMVNALKQFSACTTWQLANRWLETIRVLTPLVLSDDRFMNLQREIMRATSEAEGPEESK